MSNKRLSPKEIYQELFEAIHLASLFPDGKVIADAIPRENPLVILAKYRKEKDAEDFDLRSFVDHYFELPKTQSSGFVSDTSQSTQTHIEHLWPFLMREADREVEGSSLVPLPFPYIVPGGRFNEIYYWDSYFTMLGLEVSGHIDLIEHMVNNFSYLIKTFGFIPNGNRTYFLSRSQPPFFAQMVNLLSEAKGGEVLANYLDVLQSEYRFWMRGHGSLNATNRELDRVVQLPNGQVLNRYWDNDATPRQEMYSDDLKCLEESTQSPTELYRNLRAACESGWDFSSRWFKDRDDLGSIHTTDLLPVDLNCLLYNLEATIAKSALIVGDRNKSAIFEAFAMQRKQLIQTLFWDEEKEFFMDFDFKQQKVKPFFSLAGLFPMYFNLATPDQAASCKLHVESQFMGEGGLRTTPVHSGQQWDAPNGWAPLQWIAIKGLLNYGYKDLAISISHNWLQLNAQVYQRTGKMLEKYNVENLNLEGGGGEYPVQDGFGWTNGVYLKLSNL